MDEFLNEMLRAMIRHTDAADELNYGVQISNLVGVLGKLARHRWQGKGDLWRTSQPIWKALRDVFSQHERLLKPDEPANVLYLGELEPSIQNMAFLAQEAIGDGKSLRTRGVCQTALREILRENGPAKQAAKLIWELSEAKPGRPTPAKEATPGWDFSATVTSDAVLPDFGPSTLTSCGWFDLNPDGALQVPVNFAYSPLLQGILREHRRNDPASVLRILNIMDATDSPREKNACVEALRLIGGCHAAQRLSECVTNNRLYVQCVVLCALDSLASQPYRVPMDDYADSRDHQIETVDIVLQRLQAFEPESPDLRAIRQHAMESVSAHGKQCRARS